MSFQVIATLLVVILVSLYIFSHFYQKKEKSLSTLEAKYVEALKIKDREKALKFGLEYFARKGFDEEMAKARVEKDLGHA
jgi:dsRNA-specific ribonuclease